MNTKLKLCFFSNNYYKFLKCGLACFGVLLVGPWREVCLTRKFIYFDFSLIH